MAVHDPRDTPVLTKLSRILSRPDKLLHQTFLKTANILRTPIKLEPILKQRSWSAFSQAGPQKPVS